MENAPITPQHNLPTETVDHLLDNQTKELEIRAEELELKKQEDDHGFEYGKIALEAKLKDRGECRTHERKKSRDRYVFAAVVMIILAALITIAIMTENKDIAYEIIKAAIYLSAGALGGWGVSKKKYPTPEDDSQ